MLEHLPCVRIDPAPFRPQPITSNMDERAIRFELERQACQNLRQVLQLKLQQRRTREELVNQGIMPPLKSSAAFHEQRRSLERARTEDYLKRKMKTRPERSELIRMHIMEESSAEPSLQAKQLQLKRARLADDLNDKISHRPGPMELIHKNILPVHSSIKQAIIETQFPKASVDNSSCDEDSSDSLSPELPIGQESPLGQGQGPLPSPTETLAGSSVPSPTQVPHPAPFPTLSESSPSMKLTNGMATLSAQKMGATSQMKSQPKPSTDRSAQRHKKPKDNKPKIKKLKYHQYIPPDQKGDKDPLPHMDTPYAKILQQQQLFLQLQILSQQQQHYNYQAILPAPAKLLKNQQPSSSSSSTSTTISSPPRPLAAPSASASIQGSHSHQSSALAGTKPAFLPPNLDEMKVVELKSQLKLRSLPLMNCGGTVSPPPPPISLTLSDHQPAAISPEDTSFTSDPMGEMMSSPQPCSAALLPPRIKKEPSCSTPAPCQFSQKKQCLVSSAAPTTMTTAPVLTTDKDKMLQEKDKQIEELTRMLRQKQRLVEVLKMQLELGKREGQVSEPVVLVRVKQEPPDKPSVPLSSDHPPSPPQTSLSSASSCDMDVTKVTVKQEVNETEEDRCETTMQSQDSNGLPQSSSQSLESQEQIQLRMKPKTKQQQQVFPQSVATSSQPQSPLSHWIFLRVTPPQPWSQTATRLQSTPAKLPGHNSVQQLKADDQSKQSSLMGFQKQQNTKAQNGGLHISVDPPQQGAPAQCLSAPPSLQPFFKDQESAPSGKNTSPPSSQTEVSSSLDILFSPLSPASIKTAASSPHNKDTENEDDFIDIILQTGEMSTTFTAAPDPSLDHLNSTPFAPSPPPSPLQLLLSPPIPPRCDTPQPAPTVQSELQCLVNTTEEKHHLSNTGSGRLEDFLESTTGKPLLGVEPGGLLTLIDDLHSQMLCTPSILDHPPSPMDIFDMEAESEQGLDSMDWLDLTMGEAKEEEPPTLAPLVPQTPPSVFSTDFLDSYDLQIHWDSCL
ncbi:hypothetical protein INR49_028939 [Caranx melampygus]|nr:hypothetical protein INR49_028939 [Caranx melampygus]